MSVPVIVASVVTFALPATAFSTPETISDGTQKGDLLLRVESVDEGHRRGGSLRVGFYGYPYFSWGWGWGWPYWDGAWAVRTWDPNVGAIDLNIRPKSAEVFVDGSYVGRVDQLDGFPRYLWVESGTRHVVVYKPGFETLARRIRVRPGERIDVREQMVPGEAKTPEELFEQLEPEPAPAQRTDAQPLPAPRRDSSAPADEEWRRPAPRPSAVEVDQRRAPGRVHLLVEPADAVVYLDGRLLGSGEEVGRLHHGLMVDPGGHELEVLRPGRASERRRFEVGSDEDVSLEIRLQSDPP